MHRGVLSLCVAMVVAAGPTCVRQPGVSHSERDRDGIRIVENRSAAWPDGSAWRVSDTPFVSVGGGDAYFEARRAISLTGGHLSNPARVRRLANGTIVLALGGMRELRFYDEDGQRLFTVGDGAKGPAFIGLHVLSGDTILAFDQLGSTLYFFDASGHGVGALRLPRDAYYVGRLHDGTHVVWKSGFSISHRQVSVSRPPVYVLRLSPDASAVDTLATVPGPEMLAGPTHTGHVVARRPFGRGLSIAAGGDRILISTQDTWEIRAYRADGEVVARYRRPRPPERLMAATIERDRAQRIHAARSPAARQSAEETFPRRVYPDRYPAHGEFLLDRVGNLWVRAGQGPEGDPDVWSVLDAQGRYLGDVQTPSGLRVHDIGEDYVLGLAVDEHGAGHVRLHRLIKAAR
jgi:hypothetical protein